jgi:hypothetical protein
LKHRFGEYYCQDCGEVHQYPINCGNRFCVICSGGPLAQKRKKMQDQIAAAKRKSSKRISMITLTIKNVDDLRLGINHLLKSFEKLRSKRMWKDRVEGGIRVMEVTLGRDRKWHPHLHLIVQCGYIPLEQLQATWQVCKGVDPKNNDGSTHIGTFEGEADIFYCTSYLNKPGFPEEFLDYVNDCLKGRRLFASFGTFWRIVKGSYKTPHVCPGCGSTQLVFNKLFYIADIPDLRGVSPPLDRTAWGKLEPRLVDRIEAGLIALQRYHAKREKSFREASARERKGKRKEVSCVLTQSSSSLI